MRKPPHVIDIFLLPGEVYFGDRDTRIRTLLGSCVAITLWHPQRLIGGMCHYMLPSRNGNMEGGPDRCYDGRYADEAMQLLLGEMRAAGTAPGEYEAKLFGGGNMLSFASRKKKDCEDVACRNIRASRELLARHGIRVVAEHVGERGHRNVLFDIWSGHVWLRHTALTKSPGK